MNLQGLSRGRSDKPTIDLKATSTPLPHYEDPYDRRRKRRARLRALEAAKGLPCSVPWDDELDGDRVTAIFDELAVLEAAAEVTTP